MIYKCLRQSLIANIGQGERVHRNAPQIENNSRFREATKYERESQAESRKSVPNKKILVNPYYNYTIEREGIIMILFF